MTLPSFVWNRREHLPFSSSFTFYLSIHFFPFFNRKQFHYLNETIQNKTHPNGIYKRFLQFVKENFKLYSLTGNHFLWNRELYNTNTKVTGKWCVHLGKRKTKDGSKIKQDYMQAQAQNFLYKVWWLFQTKTQPHKSWQNVPTNHHY